jgi:K+-sensing histidine kinase KdpD
MEGKVSKSFARFVLLPYVRSTFPRSFLRRDLIVPLTLSLAMVLLTTLILLTIESPQGADHLVIAYLFPITAIAIFYGSSVALVSSAISGVVAAYFLFPPTFSLYIASPRHVAELGFFMLLAAIASKVTALLAEDIRSR